MQRENSPSNAECFNRTSRSRSRSRGGLTVHSDQIKQYVQPKYLLLDLDRLQTFLFERSVLSFGPLRTALYPAATEAKFFGARPHAVRPRNARTIQINKHAPMTPAIR